MAETPAVITSTFTGDSLERRRARLPLALVDDILLFNNNDQAAGSSQALELTLDTTAKKSTKKLVVHSRAQPSRSWCSVTCSG